MMEHMVTNALTGLCLLLSVALVALWRVSTRRIGELRRALDLASRHADESREAALTLGEMARTEERKAKEFFDVIAGIEKERDGWQKFYRSSSHAAGVAQSWLMRDLSRVVAQANTYAGRLQTLGQKVQTVQVDPRLQEVLEDFSLEHAGGKQDVVTAPVAAPEALLAASVTR